MSNRIADLHIVGAGASAQCFAFYIYDEDGSNRQENISDWALEQFRAHYKDEGISKWDIFYYVYALLHQPAYREKYAANLKRDLPHIPFVEDPSQVRQAFWRYAEAGKKLAELHVNYESQPEYPLEMVENTDVHVNWRVESETQMDCFLCQKHKGEVAPPPGGYIYEGAHWLVCHAPVDKGPLGTLFIESRRHFLDFAEANDEELAAYGPLLKKVYAALKSADGGGARVSNRFSGGHSSFPCLAGPAQGR